MKMVRVTWNDAATYDCTFNSESFGLVKSWPAQSVGWLVRETLEEVVLAQTHFYENEELKSFIVLPRGMVVSIENLFDVRDESWS